MVDIRITEDLVTQWKNEERELSQNIGKLERQLEKIKKKLEFVRLMEYEQEQTEVVPRIPDNLPSENPSEKPKKADVLLEILQKTNNYMSPMEIKNALRIAGESEKDWQPKFLYVHQVLARLLDQKAVERHKENGKYRITNGLR